MNSVLSQILSQIKGIINLADHVDIPSTIESIKKNIDFRGPNVWILIFAILVASVGLNVNSVPVIIGAMLISPLMGPIMGIGLSLGINDTILLKRSLKNWGVMVVISVIASTAFFLITPLTLEAPTELLARTKPTIYDVFIALFSGLAGIVEGSRKEKGTVIAGVAIATALMPPLCTAGYGIANANLAYFLGAVYLFFINSLFIALATFIMARYLQFPYVSFADPEKQKRVKRSITIFTVLMVIPSIYSAVTVIQENTFTNNARRFITDNKTLEKSYIYDYNIDLHKNPAVIELSIAGEPLSEFQRESLYKSIEKHGIQRDQLIIRENTFYNSKGNDTEVIKSIFERSDKEMQNREKIISDLQRELASYKERELPYEQIAKELLAQHPDILSFSIARGAQVENQSISSADQLVVIIGTGASIDSTEVSRMEQWLAVRLNIPNVKVIQSNN